MKCGSCRATQADVYSKVVDESLLAILKTLNVTRPYKENRAYFCDQCIEKATSLRTEEGRTQDPQDRDRSLMEHLNTKKSDLSESVLETVQRRLFVDDAMPLESDLHCSETVECESMEWSDVTILNEKLPDLYSAIQFRVRQTSRESSDTETEETKPKKIKTRLDIPSPQTFRIPSTSPRKSADCIVVQCPFPSEKPPNNHVYLYLNEENGNYKYYVLTEKGMQGHHKSGRNQYLICANKKNSGCTAYLRAPNVVVPHKWNLFSFSDGRNHTCHKLSESLAHWNATSSLIRPPKLKVVEQQDSLDELFDKMSLA